MIITLRNKSPQVSRDELERGVAAINRQIAEHLAPHWEGSDGQIVIEDDPVSEPEALLYLYCRPKYKAFHWDPGGKTPTAWVDTYLTAERRESLPWLHWTVATSHEVLEMLVDPELKRTVMGPYPECTAPTECVCQVKYCMEICDPVQTDIYEIDGVSVINFVLPRYYDPSPVKEEPGQKEKTNHLGLGLEPFGWRPGGQLGFWDPAQRNKWVIYPGYEKGTPHAARIEQKGRAHRFVGYAELAEKRAAK